MLKKGCVTVEDLVELTGGEYSELIPWNEHPRRKNLREDLPDVA